MHIPRPITRSFIKPAVPAGVAFVLVIISMIATRYAVHAWFTARPANAARHASIGDTVSAPGITVRVDSVRTDAHGVGPLAPHPGNVFIVPTVVLTNTGHDPIDLVPLLYFHVRDGVGNVYPVTAIPNASPQYSGTILPNDTVRQDVGFDVPRTASPLTLYVETGAPSSVIAIDLTSRQSWWRLSW